MRHTFEVIIKAVSGPGAARAGVSHSILIQIGMEALSRRNRVRIVKPRPIIKTTLLTFAI